MFTTSTKQNIIAAQEELDYLMEHFYSINDDGGSPDDRYRILLNVSRKYQVDECDLSN
jgi:hypothetical protein